MDAEKLQEIRVRLYGLEEGPWTVDTDKDGECWIRIPHHDLNFGDVETTDVCCFEVAEFIAHSREDIPWLLNELDNRNELVSKLKSLTVAVDRDRLTLLSEVDRLRKALETYADDTNWMLYRNGKFSEYIWRDDAGLKDDPVDIAKRALKGG